MQTNLTFRRFTMLLALFALLLFPALLPSNQKVQAQAPSNTEKAAAQSQTFATQMTTEEARTATVAYLKVHFPTVTEVDKTTITAARSTESMCDLSRRTVTIKIAAQEGGGTAITTTAYMTPRNQAMQVDGDQTTVVTQGLKTALTLRLAVQHYTRQQSRTCLDCHTLALKQ